MCYNPMETIASYHRFYYTVVTTGQVLFSYFLDHQEVCLKKCGMSIQEMKEYLDLCLQGQATIPQRKEMLTKKQEALRRSIQELEDSVAYIDWKQNFYDEVLAGVRPYISNLIPLDD